ncbi:hypothetical protein RJ639_022183 [Escallonia herrerae]|uniref:Integrase catalytic domain-containing protein n=1 Tax=Escallonia herrerae TaxID=1293975 RepID=A0AA89AFU7_9ASTE|nr:hypothetical protein RJ639_022183 [Escallonia herrerae]
MTDAVATASIPATVISPAVTIDPPSTNTVLPPLQTANVSAPTTTLPVMSGQADLMAVLRAMQQTIERLQVAVDNQPPSEQHVTGTRRQPVKQRLNFHEEAGTSKTPERIQVEDGQSDDERRNLRSRRQESSYEAHSTRRDSYEHRDERYTSAPVIIGRPFTEEVDHFPTLQNFKMPPCESYDGTGDPMKHLARFTSGMNLHLVPDQIMCRAFPVTLKGAAHLWFQHLASRSISCWAQLTESFHNNFLTSRIQRKNSSALFRIVQGPKESLKSYYARFNTEKLLIDNLDSGVTFATMARGVRPGTPLCFSLNKRPPEHMADLLDRVEKYLRAEEDSITTTQDEGTSGQKWRDRPEGKILEEPKRSRTTLSKHFTPLTTSREHILNQIKGQDILKWPKPMRMPADRRDAQLYCQFHKDHGHTTEECKVLRREIENLIARGHLKQFVKTERQGGKRGGGQRRHDGSAPKEPPVINTISGGLSAGGTSRSARKAYARQVNLMQGPAKRPKVPATISFDHTDLEEILTPHDDDLVISLQIDAYVIKRILVDTGSTADILFEEAFSQIKISRERIRPVSSPLYGFTEASAPVEGVTPLTVVARSYPLQDTQSIDFLVVKIKSAYNGILGRAGLNKLQAIASTFHLCMKFPTPNGIGVAKGDQAIACKCYMASCKAEEALAIEDQRDEHTFRRAEPVEELNIKNFEWTAECQTSFEALKEYLTAPPLLSKPLAEEELFLYLAIAESAVSAMLVRNQNSKQLPIYYVSKVLQGAELRYPDTEKLAFALLIAARKLRPYFQSHSITVLTDKPFRRILHKPDVSGRLVPWSIELAKFDIHYKPRPSIKGQALADFIVECTLPIEDEEQLPQRDGPFTWTLHVDGSSNANGSGAGLILHATYALREVHEGICGQHLGGKALAHKILRQGYYWPIMQQDPLEHTKKCDACQRFSPVPRLAPTALTTLNSPIPFAMWGMDILGPFPPALAQRKFVIVAIDYFTKWVEAEALSSITEQKCEDFFWRSVVCHFGIPRVLVTDNGRQFNNHTFRAFCANLSIEQRFTSVAHPQTNGQTEVTNRTLLQGLKKKLDGAKGLWVDELYKILWGYQTTTRNPTGETPFNLAFGTEALIPVEIGLPSLCLLTYDPNMNDEALRCNLDLLDEQRDQAQL